MYKFACAYACVYIHVCAFLDDMGKSKIIDDTRDL